MFQLTICILGIVFIPGLTLDLLFIGCNQIKLLNASLQIFHLLRILFISILSICVFHLWHYRSSDAHDMFNHEFTRVGLEWVLRVGDGCDREQFWVMC